MADSKTMTCRPIRDRAASLLSFIVAGLGMGLVGAVIGLTMWRNVHPIRLNVESAEVVGHSLVVLVSSAPLEACIRINSHALYGKDSETGQTIIWPLGFGLGGVGTPGVGVQTFKVILPLPEDLEGDVSYTIRSYYECWPAGLVRGAGMTLPIPIHVSGRSR